MITILIFAGLGLASLAFLLWFLVALLRDRTTATKRPRQRRSDRSLAVVLMDRYQRNKHAA